MSTYQFNVSDTDNRVQLHSDYIKRAVQSVANSHTTRRANKRWDTEEVITACELYTSGWKPKEIAEVIERPYITVSNKLTSVIGKRTGVAKIHNSACVMHEENRIRSIVGQELMTWGEAIKKVK